MRKVLSILISIAALFICACSPTVNEGGQTPPEEVYNMPYPASTERMESDGGEKFCVMGTEYPAACSA